MAIPTLPPASSEYSTTVVVGVNVRPYFEAWYDRTKLAGEAPADFIVRQLKEKAKQDYIQTVIVPQLQQEAAQTQADLNAFDPSD